MTVSIKNPAHPSEIVATYEETPIDALPGILEAARAAQREWVATTQPERGKAVRALLDGFAARSDEIALSITKEMGKLLGEARGEVAKSLSEGHFMVDRAGTAIGEVLPSQRPGVTAYTMRRPRGVIAGICPWNFPFGTPIRKTIPALIYGNAVILKPSIATPGAVCIMAEVARQTLPEGLFQIVIGSGGLGGALSSSPRIDGISFTGSVKVGKMVAAAAVENLTELSLELGGKNPAILNDAADLDAALNQIYASAFAISGQRCTAVSRVIVNDNLKDAAIDGLVARANAAKVGDGTDPVSTMGPLIGETQLTDVAGFVDRARAEGATIAAGGNTLETNTGGYFYRPTIVTDVHPDMEIAREEVFGPVLSVLSYETEDKAITIANDVAYGLTSSLFSEDASLVQRFVAESQSGMLHVNGGTFPEDHMPFVGVKDSAYGVGGSNGPSTLQFYTTEHAVYLKGSA